MISKNILILAGSALDPEAAGNLAEEKVDGTWIVRRKSVLPRGSSTVESRRQFWEKYVVVCDSVAQLRLITPFLRSAGRSRRVKVVIASTDRGEQFSVPSSFSVFLQGSVTIKRRGANRQGILASYSSPAAQDVFAVITGLMGGASLSAPTLPSAGLRVGIRGMETAPWAVGDLWSALIDDEALILKEDDIYPVDVVVGDIAPRQEDPYFPAVVESRGLVPNDEAYSWSAIMGPGGASLTERLCSVPYSSVIPPVDTHVISPRGFLPYPAHGTARLRRRGERMELCDSGRVVMVLDPYAGFTENAIAALRTYQVLDFDQLVASGPVEAARLLSQLAVAGVPTRTGLMHPVVRHLLGRNVAESFENLRILSPLERESWSISMRREALDRFGGARYWRSVPAASGLTTGAAEAVSALLTTKRPEQVAFALAQMERQTWPEMEVVLGLHGFGADDPRVRGAVARFDRPIQVVEIPKDVLFGSALNRVSQAASGAVLTKVDDDDLYSEHHVRDLMQARMHTGATLVGCQVEFVYLEFLNVTSRREPMGERFHNHVAGGSMTLRKEDLLSLGGWRPVRRAVDRCLLQGVAAKGGSVYRIHGQGYLLQRRSGGAAAGHTWNPEEAHLLLKEFDQFRGFMLPPQIRQLPGLGEGTRDDRFSSHFEQLRPAQTQESSQQLMHTSDTARTEATQEAALSEYADVAEANFAVPGVSQHRAPFGRGQMDALFDNRGSDVLVVSLHGALDRHKYTTPRFERYRSIMESPYSALYLADPALALSTDLALAWYVGYDNCDTVRASVEWIQRAARASGATRIILAGSSGGGFAALQIAPLIEGSIALVFQPQTVLSKYFTGHVSKFRRMCFPDLDDENWEAELGRRVSAIEAQRNPGNSRVRYVQNRNDSSHYEKHFKPFMKAFGLDADSHSGDGRISVRVYDGPNGHKVPSRELFMEELETVISRVWTAEAMR